MLWGLVYIIPLWLSTYDPMLIALARYTIFGLFSAVLLVFNGKYLAQVSKKDWICATALGVVGNLFFYWLLASAVQLAGAPIAGAFTAVIPISVAIVANSSARRCGAGVPWSSLVFPLWLGVFYAFLSLLVWTWYPISNANWLIAHPKISPMFWTAAQGAATLPTAAIGLAAYTAMTEPSTSLWQPTPTHFIIFGDRVLLACHLFLE